MTAPEPMATCDRCLQPGRRLIPLEWRGGWLAYDPIPMAYCPACYREAQGWPGEVLPDVE